MRSALALAAAVATVAAAGGSAAVTAKGDLSYARAYVKAHCRKGAPAPKAAFWGDAARFNALYGDCLGGDGRAQHAWFFVGRRFVGLDAPTFSHQIDAEWRDQSTIAFMYVLFRETDYECCPTGGGRIVRFHWNGKRVVRLDPLPRRAYGGHGPGR